MGQKLLHKCLEWCRKWPYIAMLMLIGAVYLTGTGNWHVYATPFEKVAARLRGEELNNDNAALDQKPDGLMNSGGERPGTAENIYDQGSLYPEGTDGMDGQSTVEPGAVESMEGVTVPDSGASENTGDGTSPGSGPAEGTGAEGSGGEGTGFETSEPVVDIPQEIPTWRDPSEIVYTRVEDSYFSDAVFIGDSRTVGMYEYGGLGDTATFYAATGLNIYKMLESPLAEVPETGEKISVEEALQKQEFAKIYMMIGINEMGTGTVESFMKKYSEVVARLRELQPDAIIYLQGIMKVTTERSEKGDYIHNEGIDARNAEIAKLADNVHIYYLDVNSVLCDETGGMDSSYTFDGVHLKAQYIEIWKDYLKSHAVDSPF